MSVAAELSPPVCFDCGAPVACATQWLCVPCIADDAPDVNHADCNVSPAPPHALAWLAQMEF